MKKIGVFGLWHLGSVLTASWSKLGNKVIGFDYDKSKIDNLKRGVPPIFEPLLEETIKDNLKINTLNYTNNLTDLNECDYVFLAYDTPVDDNDISDTTILSNSINDLKKVLKKGTVVIISSQSPVGFCSELRESLKERDISLELAYSPENLRLGEAIQCYLEPGRIILGTANKEVEEKCLNLFNQIKAEVICMSLESAEMVKHGINSFLAASIVFTNHIADLCETNNALIDDVVKGMKSDPRIGPKAYLSPGIGFSGGTLGRDLKVLDQANIKTKGFAKIFGDVHKFNSERKYAIVRKIEMVLGSIEEKKLGILGLTYKPGTSTLRRSIPMEIVDLLFKNGAKIKVFDPKADYSELKGPINFQITNSILETVKNVDLLIILTEWQEFKDFDLAAVKNFMAYPKIFDTKNCLNASKLMAQGFEYFSIGR